MVGGRVFAVVDWVLLVTSLIEVEGLIGRWGFFSPSTLSLFMTLKLVPYVKRILAWRVANWPVMPTVKPVLKKLRGSGPCRFVLLALRPIVMDVCVLDPFVPA